MHAELIYVFRHALLRDAAYQLHLPADRARLHALAFVAVEALAGGRPPAPPALTASDTRAEPHATDAFALELAGHVQAADARLLDNDPDDLLRLYLRRHADFAERSFRTLEAADAWRRVADLHQGGARGEALRRAAFDFSTAGRTAEALALYEQSCQVSRASGDRVLEARATQSMAHTLQAIGDRARAEALYGQVLAVARELNDMPVQASALNDLATVFIENGRLAEAEVTLSQARELHRQCGNRVGEGVALTNLGIMSNALSRANEGEQALLEALAIHRALGRRPSEGRALGSLAQMYMSVGQPARAQSMFEQALATFREVGDRRGVAVTVSLLGSLFLDWGKAKEAEEMLLQGLALNQEVGNRSFVVRSLRNLGSLMHSLGRAAQAREYMERALAIAQSLKDDESKSIAEVAMADVCDDAEAETLLQATLGRNSVKWNKPLHAIALCRLAGIQRRRGELDAAEHGLLDSIALLRASGRPIPLGGALCELGLCRHMAGRFDEALGPWREGVETLLRAQGMTEFARQRQMMQRACAAAGLPELPITMTPLQDPLR